MRQTLIILLLGLSPLAAHADSTHIVVKAAAQSGDVAHMRELMGASFALEAQSATRYRTTKQYVDYRFAHADGFEFLVRFPTPARTPPTPFRAKLKLVDFEPFSADRKLFWYPVFSTDEKAGAR